jgi:hypothetical protein
MLLATPAPWVNDAPAALRRNRAIQVLERIVSPEARLGLETLAKGVPTARETQNAKVALERLANQSSSRP